MNASNEGPMDSACEAYRQLIRADENRYWRYELWNPDWKSEYVDLMLRQGRKHPERARKLADICGGLADKEIVDVGCGFGRMASELALQGAAVTGIEFSDEFLAIARLVAESLGITDEKMPVFRQGAAEAIPSRDNQFDVVWSDQTIEHVQDVELSLSEMIRVLKPGGLLFVRCPNYLALSMREPHFGTFWPPYQPRSVYRWLLRRDYARRAGTLQVSNVERNRILEAALSDAYDELDHLNFVKPYGIKRVLDKHDSFDWRFIRTEYRPARKWWKRPAKWLWVRGGLDVLFSGGISLVGTKEANLEQRLGRSPIGLMK